MKDQVLNGWVILDNMAFSKAEILEQRKDICDLLEKLEKLETELSVLRSPVVKDYQLRPCCMVCGKVHVGIQCPTLTPRAY